MIRTFYLDRPIDVSGVSGTGVVAHGVVFDDGTTVIRWHGEHRSTVVWPTLEDAQAIHGHHGTQFVWLDRHPPPGLDDLAVAVEVITARWRQFAAEGVRTVPEEFAHRFALDLADAGLLVASEGTKK